LTGPAVAATDLGPIDAVLVSHDHHGGALLHGRAAVYGVLRARSGITPSSEQARLR
jgi:hypothetical protein